MQTLTHAGHIGGVFLQVFLLGSVRHQNYAVRFMKKRKAGGSEGKLLPCASQSSSMSEFCHFRHYFDMSQKERTGQSMDRFRNKNFVSVLNVL